MDTVETRRVAVLVADGFNDEQFEAVTSDLEERGAQIEVVAKLLGTKAGAGGMEVEAQKSHLTTGSIMYDAIFVPGGRGSVDAMLEQGDAKHFVAEAFKHKKPIGVLGEGVELLQHLTLPAIDLAQEGRGLVSDQGVVTDRRAETSDSFLDSLAEAIAEHRHWERSGDTVPA
jgi:catalase